eukprot:TRINITY_DN7983_c0_g1_i4.p1 TRINITY_DN7983_c0_g1~~TRINITY_DN7983_c0_g1_i4.p1  ORF type:complete len:252 (+),score=43.11 TRINITY_DN7983_c0_g1_i4:811-1566(+)
MDSISEAQYCTPDVADTIHSLFQTHASHLFPVLDAKGDYLRLPGGVDGLKYFLAKLPEYFRPGYVLTREDRLRIRIKTSGIIEVRFSYKGEDFLLCDIGGQRSERRKWIHCFDCVDAIIYLVASNEYDVQIEEANANSLVESLNQFAVLAQLPHFIETPFIIFLNKVDLLEEKLKRVPFESTFPNYTSFSSHCSSDLVKATNFLCTLFLEKSYGRNCYFHNTCALDTKSCAKVWLSIYAQTCLHGLDCAGL